MYTLPAFVIRNFSQSVSDPMIKVSYGFVITNEYRVFVLSSSLRLSPSNASHQLFKPWNSHSYFLILVWFGVLTAVIMKSTNSRDIMPCNPLKFDRCFGETYRFHLQCQRINRKRDQVAITSRFQRIKKRYIPEDSTLQGKSWLDNHIRRKLYRRFSK
jgi:hypothetical protein